ncbi:MAG: M24 family metallopeptidase [Acidimicrobiia bacterium]
MKIDGFTDLELEHFADYQRLSYAIQRSVLDNLHDGITEREVARQLFTRYRDEGVRGYFHLPVVLFGDRTAVPDPWTVLGFWPTGRTLGPGDPVIVDASPVFGDYLVDTSQSHRHGPNEVHAAIASDDLAFRDSILDAVRGGATFREIAVHVDAEVTAAGYSNRHVKHPGEVLGHRVARLGREVEPDGDGFDQTLISWFVTEVAAATTPEHPSPTWNHHRGSDHPPPDGLWAVEPHIARDGIGVKWEELLVVRGGEVRWLDESPPHVTHA